MKNLIKVTAFSLCALMTVSAFGDPNMCMGDESDDNRAAPGKKGSFLVLPKVEISWDAGGNLVQDTFVTLSNDGSDLVGVKIYYLDGDTWEILDSAIRLTPEEPYYWSLAAPSESTVTGMTPRPFTHFLAGGDVADQTLRGAVFLMAVSNDFQSQRQYNRLAAKATIVNYPGGWAGEYDAWSFCRNEADAQENKLNFDGCEYDYLPGQVLADLFTDGSDALSGGGVAATVVQELTLLVMKGDFTNTGGPKTTLAFFTVHKQDETPLTWNQDYCITCWDSVLISTINPTVFNAALVNADRVKARIETFKEESICDPLNVLDDSEAPLIGVQAKVVSFATGGAAYAISELTGQLAEEGKIRIRDNDGTGPIIPGGELNADTPATKAGADTLGL